MKTLLRALALGLPLSMAALASGCGGSTNSPAGGSDAGGTGDANAKGETGSSAATFTEVYTNVIATHGCTVCHAGTGAAGNLDMSTQAMAYQDLVGVTADGPSCGGTGLIRVVKGDANMSLLYEKVSEASPPCGAPMPLGGATISAPEMALVMGWINAGAMND